MKDKFNVLFLCTGNSARSIMAETISNQLGRGRLHAFSAGSRPTGQVHPMALSVLQDIGFPTTQLQSKSWSEFAASDAPEMDFIITLCDRAAGEPCPVWPGHPITAHWNVPDPASETGDAEQSRKAFQLALHDLQQRISLMLALRLEALDRLATETRLSQIGQPPADSA
jgi:arsenate reductase